MGVINSRKPVGNASRAPETSEECVASRAVRNVLGLTTPHFGGRLWKVDRIRVGRRLAARVGVILKSLCTNVHGPWP